MDKLTPKQEMFVQGIVAGLSQRQAYRKAYNTERMNDETVDVRASELLKNGKVTVRYRELLKQFSNLSLWSREQSFNEYEWLKNEARADIETNGVRQANSNAFLAALEGMNSMAFHDIELLDEKIKLEIEKLKAQVSGDDEQEDKLVEFTKALREVMDES